MLVVYTCAALYKISTGTPASRGPSATAGLLVINAMTIVTAVTFCGEEVNRCEPKLVSHVGDRWELGDTKEMA